MNKNLYLTLALIIGFIILFSLYVNLKIDYGLLSDKMDKIELSIKETGKVNDKTTIIYEQTKQKDQQLIKDAGRAHLLYQKPTLVEKKINDSFQQYMDDFEK